MNNLFKPIFFTGEFSDSEFGENVKLRVPKCNGVPLPVTPGVLIYKNHASELVNQAVCDAANEYLAAISDNALILEQRIRNVGNMLNKPIIYNDNGINYVNMKIPNGMKLCESATAVVLIAYLMGFADGSVEIRLNEDSIAVAFVPEKDCRTEISELSDICSELGIRIEYSGEKVIRTVIYPFQIEKLTSEDFKNPDDVVYD